MGGQGDGGHMDGLVEGGIHSYQQQYQQQQQFMNSMYQQYQVQ